MLWKNKITNEYLPADDRIFLIMPSCLFINRLILYAIYVPPKLPQKSIIDNLNMHCDISTFPYSDVIAQNIIPPIINSGV